MFLDNTAHISIRGIGELPIWHSSRRWHRLSFAANWMDNVICREDDNLYAAHLLLVLTCSKHVWNATLWSLEKFVNSPKFNIDYILELVESDLKQEIQHLGMENKNTTDIMEMLQQIKNIHQHGHFPCTLSELIQYDGFGTKIASLVLYFAFGQNNAISVDSHVIKCAIALKWVPAFASHQMHFILLCSSGYFFIFGCMSIWYWWHCLDNYSQNWKLHLGNCICDAIIAQQLLPMIDAMLSAYQPSLLQS